MKKKKIGLLPRLIIAIILGIVFGMVFPETLVRVLATFNAVFGQFLGFAIPLIIIGFIAPGIGELGKGAGRILAITAILAYVSTIFSGTVAYFANSLILPTFLTDRTFDVSGIGEETMAASFIEMNIPPIMEVMTALIIAFTLGIGMAAIDSKYIKGFMDEFQNIVSKLISEIIIPLLPIHIMGIFANLTFSGQTAMILSVFSRVFILVIALHIIIIIIQYSVAGTTAKANPFKLIKGMLPAYFTAIGTQSSAATIPVTLVQTKKNGVNEGVAEFVIPLCATIHLSGSTITLVSCSMAIMMLNDIPLSFGSYFGFILALGVTMVAAPGVPGGAVMAALGILESILGFDQTMLSLMIALYLAQDSFGTACNVTGDGAIAVIVNKISGFKLEPKEKLVDIDID